MTLTIQIYHQQRWHDAAVLDIPDPVAGRRGEALLSYHPPSYVLEHLGRDDLFACSLNYPVDLMLNYRRSPWFGFLDDIMPSGAARRYWTRHLGLEDASQSSQDYQMLAMGTIAPVGNLRIKEALPCMPEGSRLTERRFTVNDVVERHADFLEYAQALGAIGGGATGAGGEAPKLLIRCSAEDEVWIDTFQDDPQNLDQHYLVKFPRGRRSEDDCDILRAEYHYYHELADLGQDTIDINNMRLLEGDRYPSLWLPRSDVEVNSGVVERYGLESVYSLLNKPSGASLNHFHCIEQLVSKLQSQYRVKEGGELFDCRNFVSEWVRRDFLNVVFGNSDNHGRNTALIKRPSGMSLSPIYDFAPMKADPEGVIRSTIWGAPFEEGGHFDWYAICQQLENYLEPGELFDELRQLADKLEGLPQRLAERGVSQRLLGMPTLGFDHLSGKLRRWRLLD